MKDNTLSSIFNRMAASIERAKLGKIQFGHGIGWVLGDTPYVNPQGVSVPPRMDALGRIMTLKPGGFVTGCPAPPNSDAVPKVGEFYTVPTRICLNCPHRLPKRCCAVLRERNRERDLGKEMAAIVEDARRMVKEVMS